MTAYRRWPIFTKKTQEKSLIVILYGAYLFDFLLDVLKLNMTFILLFKLEIADDEGFFIRVIKCWLIASFEFLLAFGKLQILCHVLPLLSGRDISKTVYTSHDYHAQS